MRIIAILLSITLLGIDGEESWRVLRPCFERYLQTKLANLEPFHSEGRMPTEDHCLRFCAETASRCRSIVYEPLRHVCHFFLDTGSEMAVPAQHMSYFRVTTPECLEHVSSVLGPMDIEGEPVRNSPLEASQNGEEDEKSRDVTVTTSTDRGPFEEESEYEDEMEEPTLPITTVTTMTPKSLEVTTLRDEVTDSPGDKGLSQELSKMSEMIDVVSRGSDEKSMDTEEVEQELRKKMHQLKALFPEKFDELMGEERGDEDDEEEEEEELHDAQLPTTTTTSTMAPSTTAEVVIYSEDAMETEKTRNGAEEEMLWEETTTQPIPIHRRSRFFNQAKVLQISKDRFEPGFGKLKKRKYKSVEEELPEELINYEGLRRSPKKSTRIEDSEVKPFVDKAKNFLNEITGDQPRFEQESEENDDDLERIPKPKQSFDVAEGGDEAKILAGFEKSVVKKSRACLPNEAPLWLVWEGAEQRTDETREENWVSSQRECENSCNSLSDCLGYTYHEKSGQCEANVDFDGVSLKASRSSDTSTNAKFCFTNALSVFNNCPPMRGFIGFSLEVKPREEFTALPRGYDGLRMCIELCVLSTEYPCRSASFLSDEGRCLLNAESSASRPEAFLKSFVQGHLYFENECSRITQLTPTEAEHQTVFRVTKDDTRWEEKAKKEKMRQQSGPVKPMKKLRLVKIRPQRLISEIEKPQSPPQMDLINYTGAFLRRFFRF